MADRFSKRLAAQRDPPRRLSAALGAAFKVQLGIMVAICGGGNAEPQSGYADTIIATASIVDALLLTFGGLWLLPFVALADIEAFDLTSLCAVDPPALPTFTADDIVAISSFGDIPAQTAALGKIKDTINHYAWYQFCHCTTGSLTPAPTFPAQPQDVTVPRTASTGTCWSLDWTGVPTNGVVGSDWDGATYFHNRLPPGTFYTQSFGGHPMQVVTAPSPPPTSLRSRFDHSSGDLNHSGAVIMYFLDSTNAIIQESILGDSDNHIDTDSKTITIPTNTFAWTIYATHTLASKPADTITVHVDFYCGGQAPGTLVTPCATDPEVILLLQQILQGVNHLIQTPATSTLAYVPGTVHAGLTGSGSINTAFLLGLSVELTTIPTQLGQVEGVPVQYYDAGWISLGTADGYGPRQFVANTPLLILDETMLCDKVAYTFHPGVIATITELVPAP
jgi:hypothetical protein